MARPHAAQHRSSVGTGSGSAGSLDPQQHAHDDDPVIASNWSSIASVQGALQNGQDGRLMSAWVWVE